MRLIRKYSSVFLLCSLCVSTALAETVRIATYNVRNYLVMDRHVGAFWRPSYPKPESEKSMVREVIRDIRPDILVLQEMGSLDFLEELRADLNQDGVHYPYAIHMDGPDPDRHVAILSMISPTDVKKHTHLDFKYLEGREVVKRGLLEVSFQSESGELFRVFGLHLKSRWTVDKADPESELRRVREAEACRSRIIERTANMEEDRFIIAGDFNAHPGSSAMRRFYKRGSLAIGSLLPAADSRGEVWTYFYEKEALYQSVDGFVLSSAMAPYVRTGKGKIADQPGVLTGSDHRMVYADFVFDSVPPAAESK
ncbi:MAG: endonuclease/exonuclease/phosphatase family protein [Opitutales bacterium]|jgi:endonuclease/exonuclease/phosphatase family metal-dependent hydrolase|nr:endonuclease/exonuclease/phosphatase family protein [Opitutales bacterium]MDP4693667.1 endonuclease/exonuclease/phosphatase family protein [Opitutales bacterium]MDP4776406.1 endonuclease/exonuclease/phosphatase family protein [Opitutales bacterium]MDP4878814.1 endonuclease/exonuclease/phosphatase family protein [Opitutales bacterium]MDP4883637.1 endonuclease/exonuclease/phosphatase family protein [Opitutales bacterium]